MQFEAIPQVPALSTYFSDPGSMQRRKEGQEEAGAMRRSWISTVKPRRNGSALSNHGETDQHCKTTEKRISTVKPRRNGSALSNHGETDGLSLYPS